MTEPDDAPRPSRRVSPRARRILRDLQQRTWELEFLVSGALALGLGQLPSRVDDLFNRVFPLLGEGAGLAAVLGYQYLKLILYTLILAFLVHIALRAFWVSLVGLDSVFPRGVRWDKVRLGPIGQAYLKRHLPSVRELIVKTDGVASVVFSGAFYVVAIFLVSVGLVVVIAGPLLVLQALLPWVPNPVVVLLVAAVGVSAAISIPSLVDRVLAGRLDPEGRWARIIRASHRLNLRRLGLASYGPTQYTLASQLGGKRASTFLVIVLALLTTTFVVRDILVNRGRVDWVSLSFVPVVPGESGVDPRYYETYWDDRPSAIVMPSIPRDILDAEATILRVFVPFRPTRDPDAIAALCPALEPLSGPGIRFVRPDRGVDPDTPPSLIAEALVCASRLWEVSIDGSPAAEEPVFATHPTSGLPGLNWYVDVRDMAPGRHVIRIRRGATAHRIDVADEEESRPPREHQIPFWR